MTTNGRRLMVLLLIVMLSACATPSPPLPSPSSTPSATQRPSTTPSSTETASPSPTASPSSSAAPTNPVPQKVVGVTATEGGGSGEVLLRWTANPETDVVYYIVLRALSPGASLTTIGTVTPEEVDEFEYAPFVDSDATVGYYRVRAVDADGQKGPLSAEVCGASYGHSC